jgi:hypothetical protein
MILWAKGETESDFLYCQICRNHFQHEYEKYIKYAAPNLIFDKIEEGKPYGPETEDYCSLCLLRPLWDIY